MNRLDGFVDIAHLARPVRRDPLDVGILTQSDEHPAALGSYPDYADTRPRRLAAHAASLASACHGIVEGSLLGAACRARLDTRHARPPSFPIGPAASPRTTWLPTRLQLDPGEGDSIFEHAGTAHFPDFQFLFLFWA